MQRLESCTEAAPRFSWNTGETRGYTRLGELMPAGDFDQIVYAKIR